MTADILLAEGDRGVAALLIESLATGEMHDPVVAVNGREALALARTEQPRLMFIDVGIHSPSGLEVCAALKRDLRTAGIYICVIGNSTDPMDVRNAIDAGADAYVHKPFSPRVLAAKARAVLG